jgi:hypothetical protein
VSPLRRLARALAAGDSPFQEAAISAVCEEELSEPEEPDSPCVAALFSHSVTGCSCSSPGAGAWIALAGGRVEAVIFSWASVLNGESMFWTGLTSRRADGRSGTELPGVRSR